MKQPRRWVALVAALMMAASLVATPREGMGGAPGRPIENADPPQENFGDPDIPTAPQSYLRTPPWWGTLIQLGLLAITQGQLVVDIRIAPAEGHGRSQQVSHHE